MKPGFRFGIVGPGAIAGVFAESIADASVARVTRVLGRTPERARAFAARHGAAAVATLDELLADGPDRPDGIYIATPHPAHAGPALAALERGIAVLCEKPMTTSVGATEELIAASAAGGVPLMEGWMYRAHPQLSALLDVVASGAIGKVLRIESRFTFRMQIDPGHRLFAPELGGGAVLDVGGYPLSFAMAVARAAGAGDAALEATPVEAVGEWAATGVETDARATFEVGGIPADVRVAIVRDEGCAARVLGTRGEVALEHPYLPENARRGRRGALHVDVDGRRERRRVDSDRDAFALEAAAFVELVHARRASAAAPLGPVWPLVDHAESLAIARATAAWREALAAQPRFVR